MKKLLPFLLLSFLLLSLAACQAGIATELGQPIAEDNFNFTETEGEEYVADGPNALTDGDSAENDELRTIAVAVFDLTNKEREAQGLPAFVWDETLYTAAMIRANEVTSSFSHTRPNGEVCFTAMREQGLVFVKAAENIATGHKTAETVVSAWLKSEGHRKNILSDNLRLAVGVAPNPAGGKYKGYSIVQMFCTPKY